MQLPKKGYPAAPDFSAHVYCSQTAGWIKMPLGTKVGLDSGHIALHRDSALPPTLKRDTAHNFRAMFVVAKRLHGSTPLAIEIGLGSDDIVFDGDPAPPKRGTAPTFQPKNVVAKRLDGSRCNFVRRKASAQAIRCVRWDPAPPQGVQPPIFGQCLSRPNGRPFQLLLSTCLHTLWMNQYES